jgi:glycosyltransferase involved in cell wall biosynthesis
VTAVSAHDQPSVSVVIPARNAAPTLDRALRALGAQQLDGEYEVIVVDDGSDDDTAAIAQRHAPLVRLIRNERAGGAGAARNRGVQAARAPVIAFTDADCWPTPRWLAEALQALRDADIVQGAVDPDPTRPRGPFDRTLSVQRDRGFYQTANLVIRRELFDAVGGFHDWALEANGWWRFTPGGPSGRAGHRPVGEDTEFGWMACRRGARSTFAPAALVHHAVFAGDLRDDMADRWHWSRDMPGLARRVPELREEIFHRRVFFNAWTAQFDLAVVGLLLTATTRRPGCLLLGLPYARRVATQSRRWGKRGAVQYALGTPIVEAVTLAGLLTGSVAWRSLVL